MSVLERVLVMCVNVLNKVGKVDVTGEMVSVLS